MNPTAALADIVLPKTTTLEEEDISINGHGPCVTWTATLAARVGEARPDVEIASGNEFEVESIEVEEVECIAPR